MQEQTLSDLVKVESGYTSYVDLGLELYDDARNAGRMGRYRPITSHRQAFQMLSKSLQMKDGRCYLLTGSYGTGKSHLCLMFANYLQTPADDPPMPTFFQNYEEADPHEANTLRTLRASGRYLVALCKWGGKEDFDEVVLQAVDEALKRERFGEDFDTQYLQAAKKIAEWRRMSEAGQPRFFEEFERELADGGPEITANAFVKKLRGYDFDTLQEFKRIHQKITTAPFTFDKSDLIDILASTLSSEAFKHRFAGLLVLFDEFGDTMERGHMSPKAFQRFAQLCAETPAGSARMIFVGTAHKNLTDYARSYNAVDFRTASDRIKQLPLTPDGVEEIISAIVVPQKQHPLWKQYVEPRSDVFDQFVQDCTRLKLFDWLNAPKVRTKIIENIYPMHPMATFALLQLARDIASNNRSVFTFFSEDAPGSYRDFIETAPILEGDKLNLYTADRLCDYFADSLKSDNKELRDPVRERIRDYENSIKMLRQVAQADSVEGAVFKEDRLLDRLMRLMLVYEIIGKENRFDNLAFGLYCTTQAERKQLKNRLDALVARNVLYLVKETGGYEFRKSTAVNLDSMIWAWRSFPSNIPQNIVAELNELVPLDRASQHLEAKGYNQQYTEDKQLLRRFVRAADLATVEETPQGDRDYFQKLEDEILQSMKRKGEFEGIALYVVCETQEEIGTAKESCSRNTSERIVVALPKQSISFLDAIMDYKALLAIERGDEYQNFSTQDKSVFSVRLNGDANRLGAKQVLMKLRDRLLNTKEVTWHGRFAQAIATDDTHPYDVANRVMEQLYTNRNTFPHDDFNKLHIRVDKQKAQALKEAVEKLLKFTEPIAIETDLPQQRGDGRYLQRCLLQNGVLRQIKAEGNTLRCDFENDPTKFATKLPALAAMIRDIRGMEATGRLRLGDWAEKYRRPPYGQGPVALILSLACLRYLLRDSIRFKISETALGDMPVRTFDEALTLADGSYPNSFLSYRPLSSSEKSVVRAVCAAFNESETAVSTDPTVVEAHAAMKSWWDDLPPVAKVARLYAKEDPDSAAFISAMEKIGAKDAHAFLFEELPPAFGMDGGLMVTDDMVEAFKSRLPLLKTRMEGMLTSVESSIAAGLRDLFGVKQNTYSDIVKGMTEWYNKLDGGQRDLAAKWQSNASKPLLLHLKFVTDLAQTFFIDIPKTTEYGGRAVPDWVAGRVDEYLDQLKRGKEHVEANRIRVAPPKLEAGSSSEWQDADNGKLAFKDKVELTFAASADDVKIYVAEGNADPTDPTATRQEVRGDEELVIDANKTIRYAAQDAEGNWSPVQVVQLTNANAPYLPTIGPPDILFKLRAVQFNLKDADSLAVACRELFRKCVQLGMMDTEQMETAVEEALQAAKAAL